MGAADKNPNEKQTNKVGVTWVGSFLPQLGKQCPRASVVQADRPRSEFFLWDRTMMLLLQGSIASP